MSEHIRVMLPEEELTRRIAEMGAQISKDYEGDSVFIVCILRELPSLPASWQRG